MSMSYKHTPENQNDRIVPKGNLPNTMDGENRFSVSRIWDYTRDINNDTKKRSRSRSSSWGSSIDTDSEVSDHSYNRRVRCSPSYETSFDDINEKNVFGGVNSNDCDARNEKDCEWRPCGGQPQSTVHPSADIVDCIPSSSVSGLGGASTGVLFEALEKQQVTVSCEPTKYNDVMHGIPSPIESIEMARSVIAKCVCDALVNRGFTRLTPIQKYAFSIVNKGFSVVACAQTGCGKTLAYLCPMVSRIVQQGEVVRPYFPGKNAQITPLALILAPTRELCVQIYEQVLFMIEGSSIQSGVFYGGETVNEQIINIVNNHQCDIVVCTPGRILDLCDACKVCLSFVSILTLDEADIMLSLGFDKQLKAIINERDLPPKESRQTLLFSATYPEKIRQLAHDFVQHPFVSIVVTPNLSSVAGSSQKSERGASRGALEEKATTVDDYPIEQIVRYVEDSQKIRVLMDDLRAFKDSKTIVFVGQRNVTYSVQKALLANGYSSGCLHGKMDQIERQHAFNCFRNDEFRILVATSIAARGLDIPGVALVVNYDMPSVFEQYTHRIGRTGRIGHQGTAISYVNSNDRHIFAKLSHHLASTNQHVPNFLCSTSERRHRGSRDQFFEYSSNKHHSRGSRFRTAYQCDPVGNSSKYPYCRDHSSSKLSSLDDCSSAVGKHNRYKYDNNEQRRQHERFQSLAYDNRFLKNDRERFLK